MLEFLVRVFLLFIAFSSVSLGSNLLHSYIDPNGRYKRSGWLLSSSLTLLFVGFHLIGLAM